jgi:predicted kinase
MRRFGITKLMEITFREWFSMSEAMGERYPFKAVFMAGGPGSGKTWVAKQMFVPLGFRMSNTDEIMKVIAARSEPGLIQAREGDPLYVRKQDLAQKANALAAARSLRWAVTGAPYVIDTTGRSPSLISSLKQHLEQYGYDTYMVFVNTDIDTAHKRNVERSKFGLHTSDQPYVTQAWHQAQSNINNYQQMFGDHFMMIDNNRDLEKFETIALTRKGMALLGKEKKVKNPVGSELMGDLHAYYQQRFNPQFHQPVPA